MEVMLTGYFLSKAEFRKLRRFHRLRRRPARRKRPPVVRTDFSRPRWPLEAWKGSTWLWRGPIIDRDPTGRRAFRAALRDAGVAVPPWDGDQEL